MANINPTQIIPPIWQTRSEENGFCIQCANQLLKFMNLTVHGTEEYLNNNSPYYSGGNKVVEIPALVNDVIDTIFPEISGAI